MRSALTKEARTLLERASEMFDETGCVPGFNGEEVPTAMIVPDAKEFISETIDDPEAPYDPETWDTPEEELKVRERYSVPQIQSRRDH
jgi:hypothetical protein